jgi:hypothetical protein
VSGVRLIANNEVIVWLGVVVSLAVDCWLDDGNRVLRLGAIGLIGGAVWCVKVGLLHDRVRCSCESFSCHNLPPRQCLQEVCKKNLTICLVEDVVQLLNKPAKQKCRTNRGRCMMSGHKRS